MMAPEHELFVYGSGGFAREVAWLAEHAAPPAHVAAYMDDDPARIGLLLGGVEVCPLTECARGRGGWRFVVGVGQPGTRATLAERAEAAGLEPIALIHRSVERSKSVEIGAGSVICAGSILTVDIRLGRHVQINLDCTIGHDCVLDDFATLAPGVHVSGNVRIERGAYLGTGACVINGGIDQPLVVGAGATVGAGAVVTRNVAPGATVVGVPAKPRI